MDESTSSEQQQSLMDMTEQQRSASSWLVSLITEMMIVTFTCDHHRKWSRYMYSIMSNRSFWLVLLVFIVLGFVGVAYFSGNNSDTGGEVISKSSKWDMNEYDTMNNYYSRRGPDRIRDYQYSPSTRQVLIFFTV